MCDCTLRSFFVFRSHRSLPLPTLNVVSPRKSKFIPHSSSKISNNPPTNNNDFLVLKKEDKDDDLSVQVNNEEEPTSRRRCGKKQLMKRSNLLAKQVISVETAAGLGFVSQLWVDTESWMVVLVEVRPNLLSGNIENFLLQDVYQVGDVVLVEDESVMENELKIIGLDTLVGYNVVTTGRRSIGKVRGYTFNINSGAVDSLELDSFGVSVIPASLVSTYCLFVEDVINVTSDTITVHDGAASRAQRLTTGIWDSQFLDKFVDSDEYYDFTKQRHRRRQKGRKSHGPSKTNEDDDWDLPMDY